MPGEWRKYWFLRHTVRSNVAASSAVPVNHFTEVTAAIDVLLTQTQKTTAKRSRYTLAQVLAQMPDAEQYKPFVNSDEVLRAWDEMISVGREFGAANTNRWDAIFAATSHRPLLTLTPIKKIGPQ